MCFADVHICIPPWLNGAALLLSILLVPPFHDHSLDHEWQSAVVSATTPLTQDSTLNVLMPRKPFFESLSPEELEY